MSNERERRKKTKQKQNRKKKLLFITGDFQTLGLRHFTTVIFIKMSNQKNTFVKDETVMFNVYFLL